MNNFTFMIYPNTLKISGVLSLMTLGFVSKMCVLFPKEIGVITGASFPYPLLCYTW